MNCEDCKNYEKKEKKSCTNCKYVFYDGGWEPCKSCMSLSDWQPKEAKPTTKTEPKGITDIWYDEFTEFTGKQYDVLFGGMKHKQKEPLVRFQVGADVMCGQVVEIRKDGLAYPADFSDQHDKTATTYNGRQYREVKRKAKVGELVKIVKKIQMGGFLPDPSYGGTNYKVGDIFQVKEMVKSVDAVIKHPYWVAEDEYVVLEPIGKREEPTYKVGDRVRIVDLERLKRCGRINLEGKMYKWAGKVMTVRGILSGDYRMKEDREENCDGWFWSEEMIAGKADSKRVYTDAQIAEAILLIKSLLCDCYDANTWPVFYESEGQPTQCTLMLGHPHGNNNAYATRSEADTYNKHIGRMVSLCKALKRDMPKWVRGG